ncbi:hypothetical protein EYC98_04980 [Halieaceae bacterium IMCC14734]|uniref:Thioesterase putative domain-containing protein n=1 Tax=Candidatus Litorirhabdus singularis TaxID=2518993 RepID=A0ABT3TDF6_9GAMM|nr:hypothetical protein [Candidatus Litorirhabdus singularis]MCX2980220.1 hypothetical protein [Candidatus Litorirhabdus singularis]
MSSSHQIPPVAEIEALRGHTFKGGQYRIEPWENFLLTGCTGAELMGNALAHPIALFHMPIMGAGTSIAEMFALGQAESDLSIKIESYDWEFLQSLRESVTYDIAASITSAERHTNTQGQTYDRIQFCFEVSQGQQLVARSTITWHYTRNTL